MSGPCPAPEGGGPVNKPFDAPLYPYARNADQDAAGARLHEVAVVGAGPVGLALAIDLARRGVETVVVDDSDRLSAGSRAICFAQRQIEHLDRLGCGEALAERGVTWSVGRVFRGERPVYEFDLLPRGGHRRPAFVNIQQFHVERILLDRLRALEAEGAPVEIRGANRVAAVDGGPEGARLQVETPEGSYPLAARWVVACDGARSPMRSMMGLGFLGRVFEDNFLIADVVMRGEFPTERWFWFDPPFNPGQSALLHRQPDDVWRIDLQLGRDVDREAEREPGRVRARLRRMLGEGARFELDWVSVYSFQCRRMERFRHGRVIFAGDAAHQVSPFGARGANSGLQDAENLAWKLALALRGDAPEALVDSYEAERVPAADENILRSTRSTDFITPKSEQSRIFRDAVLDLAADHPFARPLVDSGRLSTPATYDGSPLGGEDALGGPAATRPGAPCPDAPAGEGFVLDRLGGGFALLLLNAGDRGPAETGGVPLATVALEAAPGSALAERYLGAAPSAAYLIRPDAHVAARWPGLDAPALEAAARRALGRAP